MEFVLKTVWFLLPSGFANMAPIVAAKLLPRWTAPVDYDRTFGEIRIFGDHKTIRGIVSGLLVAAFVFYLQRLAYARYADVRKISFFDYGDHSLWLGALLGAGSLGGDLVKSFVKRRIGIAPGHSWIPFDQIDWMIGTLFVAAFIVPIDIRFVLASVLLALGLSMLIKWVGYLLRLNETPI